MRPSVEMGLGGESRAYPVGLHGSQLQARHPIKCLTSLLTAILGNRYLLLGKQKQKQKTG